MRYRQVSALILAAAAFTSFGTAAASAQTAQQQAAGNHMSRHGIASHLSWQQHDRAVYVVSTLNGPLCPSGQQLSTVLWQKDGAHIFDVLNSKTNKNLYYIQVRRTTKAIIGVYAYQFGWKMPDAVRNGKCVADAVDPSVIDPYRYHQFKWVARFTTTFPQS